MKKKEEKRSEKTKKSHYTDFSLYYKSGKQKSLWLSVISMSVSIFSLIFSSFGWAGIAFGIIGIIFGVGGIVTAIIARAKLGYFNTFIIIGITVSIFSMVLGIFFCILPYALPEIMKLIEGTKSSKKQAV